MEDKLNILTSVYSYQASGQWHYIVLSSTCSTI